jgi:hypothetical protein
MYLLPLPVLMLALLLLALPASAQTEGDPFSGIPQSQNLQGFPAIGYPSALVNMLIYAAFDDPASAAFWRESARPLAVRVRSGEIRMIFVPITGRGSLPGGRLATRAALCAGAQGRFWEYADRLLDDVAARGEQALAVSTLDGLARASGVDFDEYQRCLTTNDGVDGVLRDAELAAARDTFFTRTPHVRLNESPTLTDYASLSFAIDVQLREADAALRALAATPTPDPEATDEPEALPLGAVTGQQIAPPLVLALPSGWAQGHDVLVLQDIDAIRNIPFAVYQGPVPGGVGTIVLLWGFPNLLPTSAAGAGGAIAPELIDLYLDGTRLLRVAVLETGCNIGTDIRRRYSIGGLEAVGTGFAGVGCPGLPDTRGWFAGLRQYGLNFVFYAYAEPIEALPGAEATLQAILDSVQFSLPTPQPMGTP